LPARYLNSGAAWLLRLEQPRAHRIEMNVIARALEVAGAAAVHGQGFIAPAKQMAKEVVFAIETRSVGAHQPLHALDQVASGCFDHDMKMVAHQAEGMRLPFGFCTTFAQRSQEECWILFITKDGFEVIASIHDVVNCSRVLDTQLASHQEMGEQGSGNVKVFSPNPRESSASTMPGTCLSDNTLAICECAPLTRMALRLDTGFSGVAFPIAVTVINFPKLMARFVQ
jgi:hypothetical protein